MVDLDSRIFAAIELDDRRRFYVGQLPPSHVWANEEFESAWRLHPPHRHEVVMLGKSLEVARWQQAYGADYQYTGSRNNALPIPHLLAPLLWWSQATIDPHLNGLLLNWYEGKDDYIGPHHDSTAGLSPGSPIVTISFGEDRLFRLERGRGDAKLVRDFPTHHGGVFVTPFDTNKDWKHSVPKRARYSGRRISVTVRAFSTGVLDADSYFETRVPNSSSSAP